MTPLPAAPPPEPDPAPAPGEMWIEELGPISVPLVGRDDQEYTVTILGRNDEGRLVFERSVAVESVHHWCQPSAAFERAECVVPEAIQKLRWIRHTLRIPRDAVHGDPLERERDVLLAALRTALSSRALPAVFNIVPPAFRDCIVESRGAEAEDALNWFLDVLKELGQERGKVLHELGVEGRITRSLLEPVSASERRVVGRGERPVVFCLHPPNRYHWIHVGRIQTDAKDMDKKRRTAANIERSLARVEVDDLWRYVEGIHPDSNARFGVDALTHCPDGFSAEWVVTGYPEQVFPSPVDSFVADGRGPPYPGAGARPRAGDRHARGQALLLFGVLPPARYEEQDKTAHGTFRAAVREVEQEIECAAQKARNGSYKYKVRFRTDSADAVDTLVSHERPLSHYLVRLCQRSAARKALAGPWSFNTFWEGTPVATLANYYFHAQLKAILQSDHTNNLAQSLVDAMDAAERIFEDRVDRLLNLDDASWQFLSDKLANGAQAPLSKKWGKALTYDGVTLARAVGWLILYELEDFPDLEQERRLLEAYRRLIDACRGQGVDTAPLQRQLEAHRRTDEFRRQVAELTFD